MDLAAQDAEHIDFLNANVLALLDRLQMPRCPILATAAPEAIKTN
jgi:hypothetical protein